MRTSSAILLALTFALATPAARADDAAASARRLIDALMRTKPAAVPAGLSPPAITPASSTATAARAGIIGEVKMRFPGRYSTAQVRYRVFADPAQARTFAINLERGFFAAHQQQVSFPLLKDAHCMQRGQTQLCEQASGNVLVMAMTNGAAYANSAQTSRGVSAGVVEQFAIAHLERVRKSLERAPAPARSPISR